MIKPTIGRVVWFWANHERMDQPRAAIITWVWSDTQVNLAVFDRDGVARSQTSVQLHQGGRPPADGDYCEWMPYQQGQAAKAEALEKQMA